MLEWMRMMPEDQAVLFWRIVITFVVALGAIIGSFLNVCIYRIPLEQSVSKPRSHCFSCQKLIPWYHNIPIFSWLILRGKCAYCKAPISPRYLVVEAMTAVLFLLVFQMWGNPDVFALDKLQHPSLIPFWWLFVASTVVNIGIDCDHRILLDRISIGGTLITFAVAAACPYLHHETTWLPSLTHAVVGAAIGFGIGFTISWLGEKIFLQDAFGFGDVKWMMLFGALFGWVGLVWILMLAAILGLLIGLPCMIAQSLKRTTSDEPFAMPFGPALGLAAMIWLFWGSKLIRAVLTVKTWVYQHESAMLMLLLPILILSSAWLIYRIRVIRRAIREEMEEENLTPINEEGSSNDVSETH